MKDADIVEMDAMDLGEWEGQQLTPQASDAKLAALVQQISAPAPPVAKPEPPSTRTTPATIRRAPTALPTVLPKAPLAAKRPPTITIPTVTAPVGTRPVAAAATPAPIVARPIATPPVAVARPIAPPPTAPAPPPRALVLPLPVVVAPSATIIVEEMPPPRALVQPLPATVAPSATVIVEPTPPPRALVMPLPATVAPSATIIVEADEPPRVVAPPPTAADISGAGPYSVAVLHAVGEQPPAREGRAPRTSRRAVVLGVVAGITTIVVVVAIALASGGHRTPAIAATDPMKQTDPAPQPKTTVPPTPPAAVVAVVAPAAAVVEPPIKAPVVAQAPRQRFTAKKLVLDYDHPAATPKAKDTQPADDVRLAKARAAYAFGNQRLFAGDPEAAVHAYQQSLTAYPGYVAGYRGLGLAYTQLGNKASALSALRTYARLVPNAKDIALVKQRIAALAR